MNKLTDEFLERLSEELKKESGMKLELKDGVIERVCVDRLALQFGFPAKGMVSYGTEIEVTIKATVGQTLSKKMDWKKLFDKL